jgi:AcrR family transcriptional regulator
MDSERQQTSGPGPGRPRSERSRIAVLKATCDLLHEVGLRSMTTEEIATRSGVSKATIYKWWPNKYAVSVEAFLWEMVAEFDDPATGSAAEDMRIVVRRLLKFITGPRGQVFGQLVGEAQFDPVMADELYEHLMRPRRELVETVWERGVSSGQFRSDVNPDDAIDVLIGSLLYRQLLGRKRLTKGAVDTLVDATMQGLATTRRRTMRAPVRASYRARSDNGIHR